MWLRECSSTCTLQGTRTCRKLTHKWSIHNSRVTRIHLSSYLWSLLYVMENGCSRGRAEQTSPFVKLQFYAWVYLCELELSRGPYQTFRSKRTIHFRVSFIMGGKSDDCQIKGGECFGTSMNMIVKACFCGNPGTLLRFRHAYSLHVFV